jgi:hypothetical protein
VAHVPLPGDAGRGDTGGGEGWAELTAVRWLPLEESAAWEAALDGDPFLYPQLRRIRGALPAADASRLPPAG